MAANSVGDHRVGESCSYPPTRSVTLVAATTGQILQPGTGACTLSCKTVEQLSLQLERPALPDAHVVESPSHTVLHFQACGRREEIKIEKRVADLFCKFSFKYVNRFVP